MTAASRPSLLYFAAAFGAGCILAVMTHLNGVITHYGNALFSSWTAHGIGSVAAILILALLYFKKPRQAADSDRMVIRAPWWAYLGGIAGAATVVCASLAVNSPLALSGTIALGLGGQVIFSLAADFWGLFGLPARRLDARDVMVVALILGGSLLVIAAGGAA